MTRCRTMADKTKIEWTDATWTPVKGCTRVSEGCRNCYAEIMAARFSNPGQWGEGLATIVDTPQGKDHRWTGAVRFDEGELLKPLSWRKPRRIFVCSTSDLFQDAVTDEQIDRVFAVMALCPQHTFQVLTKRTARLRAYIARLSAEGQTRWAADILSDAAYDMGIDEDSAVAVANWINGFSLWRHAPADDNPLDGSVPRWPLPNVWLGASVEDQQRADERIPDLRETPAAVRFISFEPLLGAVNADLTGIHWAIVGGEGGPHARITPLAAFRSLRDQCAEAGVAFFHKQNGEWIHESQLGWLDPGIDTDNVRWQVIDGESYYRLGKKLAGRLLDGREHSELPA